jgi:D-alanyl-lipoteichoic acid acyltransferase DltB (MBOAT superfamily)
VFLVDFGLSVRFDRFLSGHCGHYGGKSLNFNSWQYLVFFPVVTVVYYFATMRLRKNFLSQSFLLTASLFFYGCWNPKYLVLIIFSVIITWLSGILMEGQRARRKKCVLAGSIALNLTVLFFFKYYHFFAETLNEFLVDFANNVTPPLPVLNVLLPVGISF